MTEPKQEPVSVHEHTKIPPDREADLEGELSPNPKNLDNSWIKQQIPKLTVEGNCEMESKRDD